MAMIVICEKFGWDYHKYMRQPKLFLDLIYAKMNIDAKKSNIKK